MNLNIMLVLPVLVLGACASAPRLPDHDAAKTNEGCPTRYEPPTSGKVRPWGPHQIAARRGLERKAADGSKHVTGIVFTGRDNLSWVTGCPVFLGETYHHDGVCTRMAVFNPRSSLEIRRNSETGQLLLVLSNVRVAEVEYGEGADGNALELPVTPNMSGRHLRWLEANIAGSADFFVYLRPRSPDTHGLPEHKSYLIDVFPPVGSNLACDAHRPAASLCGGLFGKPCPRPSGSRLLMLQGDTGGGHETTP